MPAGKKKLNSNFLIPPAESETLFSSKEKD